MGSPNGQVHPLNSFNRRIAPELRIAPWEGLKHLKSLFLDRQQKTVHPGPFLDETKSKWKRGEQRCLLQFIIYSSRKSDSTRASISVEITIFGFFLMIFLSISTIVGLLRSQRWWKVSWKLLLVLFFLEPCSLILRICLLRAESRSRPAGAESGESGFWPT